MRKILLSGVALLAVSMAAPASAADMAARPYTKAPPPVVAPIYDWTGFYIGANGGWGQSHGCVDFVTPAGTVASGCAGSLGWPCRRTDRVSLANQSVCARIGSAGRLGRHQEHARQPDRSD